MNLHLVIGAGPIGRLLAERLAARGDTVTIATRSGSSAVGATPRVVDASDSAAVTHAAVDAKTIFVCTNPPYTDWAAQWPPIYEATITAASATGAHLVIMSNLYPYGSPTGTMTEHSPETTTEAKGLIRKDGWAKVRAAHDAGRINAVEVRASDYFGPGVAGGAHLGKSFFTAVLESRTARVVGKPQLVHSWSYLPDIVTTLIAAADYPGDWGRIWHVPSGAVSRTDIVRQLNEHYGTRGKVSGYPRFLLRTLGLVNPMMREVSASSYQFDVPYVIASTETETKLGVTATPWHHALIRTAESYRSTK